MIHVYHNPRCGKSRNCLKILENKKLAYETILYLKETPSKSDLQQLLEKLEMQPQDLIRKNESLYKTLYKGKELSREEWIQAMVDHPILIERPIVINGSKAVVARPPERALEII